MGGKGDPLGIVQDLTILWNGSLVGSVFVNGPGDQGSISGPIILKTQKSGI